MKHQVIVIRGGETFNTYEEYLAFLKGFKPDLDRFTLQGWKDILEERLGQGFEVVSLSMPNSLNAKYLEWEIYFNNLIPSFADEVIFVGNSLGSIFLAKYLSENKYPKKIRGLFLVAAPYDARGTDYSLADFVLDAEKLSHLPKAVSPVYLYQSEDDPSVPFANLAKYQKALPTAITRVFKDRGHFNIPEFPEIVEDIQEAISAA